MYWNNINVNKESSCEKKLPRPLTKDEKYDKHNTKYY